MRKTGAVLNSAASGAVSWHREDGTECLLFESTLGDRAVRIAVKDAKTNRRITEIMARVLESCSIEGR